MNNILFKETIWLNFLRSFCAGIVWAIFSLFMPNDTGMPFYGIFLFPIVTPVLLLAFALIAQVLKLFNLSGVGNVMCMIVSVPGDPLVYLLHQTKPEWVPVKEFSFINLAGLYYVYKDQVPVSGQKTPGESSQCPYCGSVVAEKTVTVLGFDYPVNTELFHIHPDWTVTSKSSSVGYIDKAGNIREGLKGDPDATLAPGTIIGKIKSRQLWIDNELVGRLV